MQGAQYQTHAASGVRALGAVYAYVLSAELPKSLLDLVFLRASQMNGCAYCIDMHARDARQGGASVEKLTLLSTWREAGSLFTTLERAALAWTEAITAIAETHASDVDYAEASAVLTEKQLSDLTLAIGVINVYNRLAIGFRRPPNALGIERATPSSNHAVLPKE